MGFKFRKSVKIAPGVKVNFGKKGTSVTVGNKRARTTISSTGKTTHSISTPIKGLTYTSTSSSKKTAKKTNEASTKSVIPQNDSILKSDNLPIAETATTNQPISSPSSKTYRICGWILQIISLLLIILSLLLAFVLPAVGIAGILFGAFLFWLGKKYRAMGK